MTEPVAPASALYHQLTLLDRDRHAQLRVPPVTDWRIASAMNAVFVSAVEFADVAREFPIAFVPLEQDANGKAVITPVALLGLRDRDNLFVDAEGHWSARYLPAFLRRYPFAYVRTDSERLSLALDEGWQGLNTAEGEALFDAQGEPTEYLQSVLKFLDRFEEETVRTRLMCARLVDLELLRSGEINGKLDNGMDVNASGFFMIDEAKLANLPEAVVLELHRNGILGLIHAHLISMGQVQALAQRMAARG